MILVCITILLIASIAVNHLLHGFGCWGLQPGGSTSAMIYDLQILTAVIGVLWLLNALARRTVPCNVFRLSIIALFVFASVLTFMLFGWAAHTSSHHQGAENLVAFLTVAATTYLVGRYGCLRPKSISATSHKSFNAPGTEGQATVKKSDNPYEPPQTIASSS